MNLICLFGSMGSGKTSFGNYLSYHEGYTHYSLADPLKDLVVQILDRPIDKKIDREFIVDLGQYLKGYNIQEFYDKHKKDTFRKISRFLGEHQDIYQFYYTKEFWIEITRQKVKRLMSESVPRFSGVVISDIRFEEEYQAFKKMGATFIKIDCSQGVCEKRLMDRDAGFNPDAFKSSSEKDWKKFKFDFALNSEYNVPEDMASQLRVWFYNNKEG